MMRSRFRTPRKIQAIEPNRNIGKTLFVKLQARGRNAMQDFTTFISHREGKRKAMENLTNITYFHFLLLQDVRHLYTSELWTLNKKIFHVGESSILPCSTEFILNSSGQSESKYV